MNTPRFRIMFVSSLFAHLVGGTEGHDQEPHQGVGHGEGGDQVVGRRVERPLVDHRQDHEEVA